MFVTVLRRRWHGFIVRSRVDPGRPQRAHQPLPVVWTGGECYQFQGHNLPAGINMVWDFGRGRDPTIHGKGGDVHR